MDKIDIARLKKLAQKATPGPWVVAKNCEQAVIAGQHVINAVANEDAVYIAAASPEVMMKLLDRLDRLTKEAQWLAIRCERICNAATCCDDCAYYIDEACPQQLTSEITGAGWRLAAHKAVEEQCKNN